MPAPAHPADISHLKVKVGPRRIEFRLTFNLYTLQQFHVLDSDGDGKISKQELDAGEKPLRDYISENVLVTINGQDADLGEAKRMDRMWPADSAGADVLAPDYAQRFVDFTFVKASRPVVENVWVGFNVFKETGELHVVQGIFEQDGKPADVQFSQNEPEYLWDTGYSETLISADKAAPATESAVPKKTQGIHALAIVVGIVAITGTLLLLCKVRRIARGGFRIGPRP